MVEKSNDTPTKTGQNIIISNLNRIIMIIVSLAIAALFAWGNKMSQMQTVYQIQIQQLNDRCEGLQKELNTSEGDISDLQKDMEVNKDDLKTRIIHLEDFNIYKTQK